MWVIVLILLAFITLWMTLSFTNTLCDNEYVGIGMCFDPAWKTMRPPSACPACPVPSPAPSPSPSPSPSESSTSGYTAEPFCSY